MSTFISRNYSAGKAAAFVMLVLLVLRVPAAKAVECSAIFPDGAQVFASGGELKLDNNAKIINSPDNILATDNLNTSANSCVSVTCSASGTPSASSSYSSFPGGADIDISSDQSLAPGDYGNLVVSKNNKTLTLSPGDYTFDGSFVTGNGTDIVISGSGTVRIFVAGDVLFDNSTSANVGGTADQLFIYSGQKIELSNVSQLVGFIYAAGDLLMDNSSDVIGAVSGSNVELSNGATVTFDSNARDNADFGDFCETSPPAAIDHYSISHDGSGVSCLSEIITFSAHNNSHGLVTVASNTIAISTSTNKGEWVAISSGGGTLNNGAAGDGAATYTFAGNSQVALVFNYTDLGAANSETLNIDVSSGTITETSGAATVVLDDPDITFNKTGFEFSTIVPQLAAKDSNIAPGASNILLRALQTSDSDPAVCDSLFANQSVNIELGAECRNPTSCTPAVQMSVNGSAVQTNNDNGLSLTSSYSSLNLAFDAAGDAALLLNYPDAGLMQMHARYAIPLDDGSGTPSGDYIAGSSNDFVVSPVGFCVEADGADSDCVSGDASCSAFVSAGSDFNLNIKAVAWEGTGDTDFCSGNSNTQNFRADVSLSPTLVAPLPGNAGTLGVTSTAIAAADNGETSVNQSVSEVGVFTINASSNYFTEAVTTDSANIGRFIPSQFTLGTPVVNEACNIGAFTYMAQDFTVEYELTAENLAGDVTQNYTGDFVQLDTGLGSIDVGAVDLVLPQDLTANLVPAAPTFAEATTFIWGPDMGQSLGMGQLETSLSLGRTTAEGPYSLSVGVLPVDEDGVTINGLDLDVDNDTIDDYAVLGISNQRYGRVFVENAFGPGQRDLLVPFVAEYFNGTGFIPNRDDNCTSYALTDFSEVPGSYVPLLVDDDTRPDSVAGTVYSNGTGGVFMLAPMTYGSVDILFSVPDFLQYDWNGDSVNENPQNTATFGTFRGNDRIIYRRVLP